MPSPQIIIVRDAQAVAQQGAEHFAQAAAGAIAGHGTFSVALSGGHTPKAMFQLLAAEPCRSTINWKQIQVFFADERCVPPDSDQSNFRLANESLLGHVAIPAANIHRMRGEIEPHQAAVEYGQLLKDKFGDDGLDLILLGMGPDGHTASLFPNSAALNEAKHRCAANFVQKLGAWRLTMTAPFINRATQVVFMVSGQEKSQTIAQVLHGPRDPQRLPSQLIGPSSGKLIWIVDEPAASAL